MVKCHSSKSSIRTNCVRHSLVFWFVPGLNERAILRLLDHNHMDIRVCSNSWEGELGGKACPIGIDSAAFHNWIAIQQMYLQSVN